MHREPNSRSLHPHGDSRTILLQYTPPGRGGSDDHPIIKTPTHIECHGTEHDVTPTLSPDVSGGRSHDVPILSLLPRWAQDGSGSGKQLHSPSVFRNPRALARQNIADSRRREMRLRKHEQAADSNFREWSVGRVCTHDFAYRTQKTMDLKHIQALHP